MTDIEAGDQAGEGTDGDADPGGATDRGDTGAAGDDRAGEGTDGEPGGDAAGGGGDGPGDESAPDAGGEAEGAAATSGESSLPDAGSGPAEGTDAEEGGEQAGASPENRLEALQEDIDAVRRRVAEDSVDQGDEAFIQEGEASEDEPVDDTIAPPG